MDKRIDLNKKEEVLPNFIIGGTSAGGTSFLSSAIIQHPEIYLPLKMRPEPHYFYKSWEYKRPLSYYKKKYFSNVKNEIAIGERSSSYLFGGLKNAKRIIKSIPGVKLIFTVRNPIERAYANYRYTALQGLESMSFDEALRNERERILSQDGIWSEIQPFNYTGRGLYCEQLEDYLKVFEGDKILIIKSECMSQNPQNTFEKVFNFLGVDNSVKPVLPPNFTSLSVKKANLQKFHREFFKDKFDLIVESIRKEEDPYFYTGSKKEKEEVRRMMLNIKKTKIEMSSYARKYLQSFYEESNSRLEKYIDFDISDWK